MALRKSIILAIAVFSIILISSNTVFSQEEEKVIEGPSIQQTPAEPEVQWLWGEVVSVGANNNEVTVKYLDYENDIEKEIAIAIDEKTTYENIKSISEINPKDNVSVDYIVSEDGKNIAKNIIIEKPESQQTTEGEVKPEEISPPEATSE
jgi:hypothetical protein